MFNRKSLKASPFFNAQNAAITVLAMTAQFGCPAPTDPPIGETDENPTLSGADESTTGDDTTGTSTTIDPCEGISDSCLWGDEGMTAEKYQCGGKVIGRFNGEYNFTNAEQAIIDLLQDDPVPELPITQNQSFGSESYDDAKVIACCTDEFDQGCEGSPAPHFDSCLWDCAQQSCITAVKELNDVYLNLIDGGAPAYIVGQIEALRDFVAQNTTECAAAIRNKTNCEDFYSEGLCDSETFIGGVWNIPDNEDEYRILKNMFLDVECEVFSYSLRDDGSSDSCVGIQDNNLDPLGDSAIDPMITMEAVVDGGTLTAQTLFFGVISAEVIGSRLRFRVEECGEGPCVFKLDSMDLEFSEIEFGQFFTVKDASASLTFVAPGVVDGANATIAPGDAIVSVTGVISSDNEFLDGFPIGIGTRNTGDFTLVLENESVGIDMGKFRIDPWVFELSTPQFDCEIVK